MLLKPNITEEDRKIAHRLGEDKMKYRMQLTQANYINNLIRNYANAASVTFRKCSDCDGKGLDAQLCADGINYIWDGTSLCKTCKGTGYIDWEEHGLLKICKICNGSGENYKSDGIGMSLRCENCNGKGVVDWVEGIRLGI